MEDAFDALHRAHASVCEITGLLPGFPGDLVRDELAVPQALADEVKRPYLMVLGGAKVSDKLAVIEALLPRVDRLLIGGGMCFTVFAARGRQVGDSLVEAGQIGPCRSFPAARTADGSAKITLPSDIVVAAESIPAGRKGLDIGPAMMASFGGGALLEFIQGRTLPGLAAPGDAR